MPRSLGGFGRLVAPADPRDRAYALRAALPQLFVKAPPHARRVAYHEPATRLNQGQTPQCVSYAGKGFMLAAPLMMDPGYDTLEVYQACQRVDEWPGENYDGTSVRALMSVLKTRGWISNYVWGQSIDDALAWMDGGYGTLIVGTNWYQSMDSVGHDGFIQSPSSMDTPIGGHAYRLNWYDQHRGGFLVVNSWGREWGMPDHAGPLSGMAYLSRQLLERLILEDGEIAAPTQVKIVPSHG